MRIKVTGFIDIEPDEFDPGLSGPLTEAAYNEWATNGLSGWLEDIEFKVATPED